MGVAKSAAAPAISGLKAFQKLEPFHCQGLDVEITGGRTRFDEARQRGLSLAVHCGIDETVGLPRAGRGRVINIAGLMISIWIRHATISAGLRGTIDASGWIEKERLPLYPVDATAQVGRELRGSMPIVRYFVLVGGLLLALLFAANRYLPEAPEYFAAGDVDRTIIRIRSARPHTEKVVFDTSHPPSVPVAVAAAADTAQGRDHQREAMAMMPEDRPSRTQPTSPIKERAARRRRTPRPYRAARRTTERRIAFDHPDFFGE